MRRKSRLFALAEYMRGRRTGVTAEELARRFDVTLRTIYRDLEALRDASLPLHSERGPGGGYSLDRAYTLPPINFAPREAALLVVLGRFAVETRFVPFTDTLERALSKVRGALDTSGQRELLRHASKLAFVGIPATKVAPAVRSAIEEAWFEQQPITLRYRRSDGSRGERTVRIDRILMERTMTLLECVDSESHDQRQIRLDRVDAAHLVGPRIKS